MGLKAGNRVSWIDFVGEEINTSEIKLTGLGRASRMGYLIMESKNGGSKLLFRRPCHSMFRSGN